MIPTLQLAQTGRAGGVAAAASDPSFASVHLLAHYDGANAATSFTESSPFARTMNGSGGAALSTTSPKFGSACSLSDDTASLWEVGTAPNWKFLHDGTVPWTYDEWLRPDNFSAEQALLDTCVGTSTNIGLFISIQADRDVRVVIVRGVSSSFVLDATFTAAYPNDTSNYHLISVTWDHSLGSNNCTLYIDGTQFGQASKTGNTPSSSNPSTTLRLGTFGGSGTSYRGRRDDARITAAMRYSGSFTPPTAPFPNS